MCDGRSCMFCGCLADVVLQKKATGAEVPVCRKCVPPDMELTWAENVPVTGGERSRRRLHVGRGFRIF